MKLVGGAGLVQSGSGANTFTGATTFSNTVTVGVDDTGHDVKFFGATSGAYMLWDESTDDLKLVGGAGLVFGGATGTNKISLTDNLADALNITQAGNSYLKFVTTDDNEMIKVFKGPVFESCDINLRQNSADSDPGHIAFNKSRHATAGSHTVVQKDDNIGKIEWYGSDGSDWIETASISVTVHKTPGSEDMPGKITFSTTSDGAKSTTERMTISDDGVGIGTTSPDGILHVHGGGNSTYNIFSRSDTKWFYIHSGSTNPAIGWDSGGSLRLGPSTTNIGGGFSEKMIISNLQVEIKQPTSDLVSSTYNGYGLRIVSGSTGIYWNIMIETYQNNGGYSPHLYFSYQGSSRGYIKSNGSGNSFNFTGQHRCLLNNNITTSSIGLIVSTNGTYINTDNTLNPSINETLPICVVTNTDNDKKVFGVISDKEDTNSSREYSSGSFVSVLDKQNQNEQRMYINSVGEGAIWVCNKNGDSNNKNIENGDYITSTTVTGYGSKQADDLLHNYTVAKITCDCDFSLDKIVKQKLKVTETTTDGVTTRNIDYDANGDVQYEDDLDENGAQQMVYKYETRFLQADGTQLVDEADYNTRLGNGESVYIACFVGCTYHCG